MDDGISRFDKLHNNYMCDVAPVGILLWNGDCLLEQKPPA
jgi:hypothetical protein